MLCGKDGNVIFAEVMVLFPSVLEHGGFVFSECVGGSGSVLLEAGGDCALCFADIRARARCRVDSGARYVVHMACCVFFVEFVFWMNKGFSK